MEIQELVQTSRASQEPAELAELCELLTVRNIKTVVEIGVHKGYLLNFWDSLLEPEHLIGVEIQTENIDWNSLTNRAVIVDGDSMDDTTVSQVTNLLGGRTIDLLFIDGDHHYYAVKGDFEAYYPLVSKHGVIVFHDACLIGHPDVDVWRYIMKLKKDFKVTTINKAGGNGYAIIIKK